jgi:SAM-dependent methyltransferase
MMQGRRCSVILVQLSIHSKLPYVIVHHSDIFEVRTLKQAREIILTREGESTDERWRRETPYLTDLIGFELNLKADSVVLDYGCGIGRLAKGLIEKFGCRVIGVDSSLSMRWLSINYVRSDRFMVVAPEGLDWMRRTGVRVDGAICVWVLQHCFDPLEDTGRIHDVMAPASRLFVLNNERRAVPTRTGWFDDGVDIRSVLAAPFSPIREGALPAARTSKLIASTTFWATYPRRADATVPVSATPLLRSA